MPNSFEKPKTPKETFLEAIKAITTPAEHGNIVWDDKVSMRFISESYKITPDEPNNLVIQHIKSHTPSKGHGTQCMQLLTQFADKADLNLYVLPATTQEEAKEGLVNWYKNFGFEFLDEPGEDHEAMRRAPEIN